VLSISHKRVGHCNGLIKFEFNDNCIRKTVLGEYCVSVSTIRIFYNLFILLNKLLKEN